jgi:CcmD family protein
MKLLGLIAAAVATAASVVHAQVPQVPEGFTVGGNIVHENLPATPFVFIAYGIVWVVLLFYVFTIWRRVGRVDQELARVNQRLGARR